MIAPELSLDQWLAEGQRQLAALAEGRLEARLLLCQLLGINRSYLLAHGDQPLAAAQARAYQQLLARRAQGEPLAYICGEREFWSLPLHVTPSTLIPRADSEALIECALQLPLPACARVADLGTGSGALALALAHERPRWQLWACDRSAAALAVARANGQRLALHNVNYRHGDWFAALADEARGFDLLLSNPPYLAACDPHLQQGDLRFEPASALVAANDGLSDLQQLIGAARSWLKANGYLLLEHGATQGPAVAALMAAQGFGHSPVLDLGGHWRATLGRLASCCSL